MCLTDIVFVGLVQTIWFKKDNKMTELFDDIQTLENAIINLTEGASDEKRMALHSLEYMLERKQGLAQQQEDEIDDMFLEIDDGA